MNDASSLSAESISALADGQLEGAQFAQALAGVVSDPHATQTWLTYHVVGDVLRSAELAPSIKDLEFMERFERRMGMELEPVTYPTHSDAPPPTVGVGLHQSPVPIAAKLQSANEGLFRWKIAAGLAGVVISGVVGVGLWNQSTGQSAIPLSLVPAEDVRTPLATVDLAETGVMIRDPRLDELLLAHRQLAGHSALQMPAGFLRNATFEGPAR